MKRFLLQAVGFILFVGMAFCGILALADGHTDAYYVRFTTPAQDNLIVGTSRAAQGIQPSVLKRVLGKNFFNYAFTGRASPYGPVYFESIRKKLNGDQNNGVFIVAVSPWCISSRTESPDDSLHFRELDSFVGRTPEVNRNPNFTYLKNNLGGNFYKILWNHSPMFLHNDGWLEVSVDMDSISIRKRTDKRVEKYITDNLPYYKFSSLRLDYLLKTVKYLNGHGKVFLVRLPIHPRMMDIENRFMPDLKDRLQDVIPLTMGYLDMTGMNNEFIYNDGNHLCKESGKMVSGRIADWIKQKQASYP